MLGRLVSFMVCLQVWLCNGDNDGDETTNLGSDDNGAVDGAFIGLEDGLR